MLHRACLDNGGMSNRVFVEKGTQFLKGGYCPSFWGNEMRLLCEQNMFLVVLDCVIYLLAHCCETTCFFLAESHTE